MAKAVKKALAPVTKAINTATIERSHGRIESREYHVLPAQELSAELPAWKGLRTIGVAIGYRLDSAGHESLDYRYYISSAELTPERFADAVRGHWAIENKLHWVLDATMNEDDCQIYRGNAAELLAGIRGLS